MGLWLSGLTARATIASYDMLRLSFGPPVDGVEDIVAGLEEPVEVGVVGGCEAAVECVGGVRVVLHGCGIEFGGTVGSAAVEQVGDACGVGVGIRP